MLNLWNRLTAPRVMRRYALLDANGRCLALRESTQTPSQDGWVEVRTLCPSWLGQRLPADAHMAVENLPAWAA